MNGILEINEADKKFRLDKLDPKDENFILLFSQSLLHYEQRARFWKPRLDLGQKCMEVMQRDIFTPKQRADYRNEGKVPVEPQELKKIINALGDQIKESVQTSNISAEDETPPQNAAKPEVVNVVLKDMENNLGMEMLKNTVIRNGLITGFPQWIWYDFETMYDGLFEQLVAHTPWWNTILPTPYFEKIDGSDVIDVIRIGMYSKAALLETFPEREDALNKFDSDLKDDPGYLIETLQNNGTEDAHDRSKVIQRILNAADFDSISGYYTVAERVFPVKSKQTLYINEEIEDVQVLPEQWNGRRKNEWINAHPEYHVRTKEVKTLWTTTIGLNGFNWENDSHWFQENGKLPGSVYVPDMVNNLPTGVGEDQLPYIFSIAASETEGLHNVRTGQGTVTFYIEGAFAQPENFGKEMSLSNGQVPIKKAFAHQGRVDAAAKTIQRKPNLVPFEFSDRLRGQAESVHSINDSILGVTHPRQSDVSKQTEITQGMKPQAPYVRAYSYFELSNTQMLLYLLPHSYTEEKIITINDDYGLNKKKVTVNISEYDVSGQANIIANDLLTVRYRAIPVPGEDSATSKDRELQQFINIISAVGNQLFQLDPKIMAYVLNSMHNRYSKQAGTYLMQTAEQLQQQQQQATQAEQQVELEKEKARRGVDIMKIQSPDVSFKFSPQDIEEAPMGAQMMFQIMNNMRSQQPTP